MCYVTLVSGNCRHDNLENCFGGIERAELNKIWANDAIWVNK